MIGMKRFLCLFVRESTSMHSVICLGLEIDSLNHLFLFKHESRSDFNCYFSLIHSIGVIAIAEVRSLDFESVSIVDLFLSSTNFSLHISSASLASLKLLLPHAQLHWLLYSLSCFLLVNFESKP